MGQKAELLSEVCRVLNGDTSVALGDELGHGIGDGVVEASVQRPELDDRERRVALDRQVGDGLAQVAVVMNHLVDGVAELQKLPAVRGRGDTDLGQLRHVAAGRP
jgi:hypothetical protein